MLAWCLTTHAALAAPPKTPTLDFDEAQDHYVLAPLTPRAKPIDPDSWRFFFSGLLNARAQFQSSFVMPPTLTAKSASPGLLGNSIDQNAMVLPWLRLTPQFEWGRTLRIVGQLDVAQGKVVSNATRDVGADPQPRDNLGDAWTWLMPRWLYGELLTKIGLFRVGMQPNHWGMGILANDGDHAQLFGMPRLGQISERVLFATKPLGEDGPLTTAIAGDLVFRDNFAQLTRGDIAWQGVLATYLESGPHRLGFFGVYRNQRTARESIGVSYTDDLKVFVFDLAAHTMAPVPGRRDAFWFAEAEGALQLGTSSALRTGALPGERASVSAYGGAVRAGLVLGAARTQTPKTKEATPRATHYGRVVTQLEWGYASGDADPNDGVQKRFTFDPNHRVGLLLFDEVLRWSSARAAVIAADPLLANGQRPQPGLSFLPTGGGVAGAQYLNPTVIVRPEPHLDVRAGVVIAQATADVVSQVRTLTTGRYENDWGGDPKRRDLGVEVDLGVHKRIVTSTGIEVRLGAEGGVLFPGGALQGPLIGVKTLWMGVLQAGLTF